MIILNCCPALIQISKYSSHNQTLPLFVWSLVFINVHPLSIVLQLTVDTVTDEDMVKLSHGLRDHIQEAWLNGWRATEA